MKHVNEQCNKDSARGSLFTSIRWPKAQTPKRSTLLDFIETVVPWGDLLALVRPHYQADIRKTGRKGYALGMMLRVHVLQRLWVMSDRQTEAALLDSHAMAKFIGTDPWQPRPPSATAIRTFRKALTDTWTDDGDLLGVVNLRITLAFIENGIECRPGEIREPIFRSMPE